MRAVYALVLAGCFSPAPQAGAPCGSNRECPDGLECSPQNTCEKPGSLVDAMPDACPTATCAGDMLLACGAPIACANGCSTAGGAHCLQLAPSNGVTLDLLDGVTADVAAPDLDFDTDDGHISTTDDNGVTTEVRPPGEGVINGIRFEARDGMGIFVANSWTFPASIEDSDAFGANSFVLFAKTTITVASVLDAGGNGGSGGPDASGGNGSTTAGGSCRGKAGRSNSAIGAAFGEGGGGGGGAGAGGDGAPSNQPDPTGVAGGSCASAPSTIPLDGGNGGGDGGQSSSNDGGGGGGAMMLVAMESITIASGGAATAPGAGGRSGTPGNGGGGGGGGGAVLLEAPIVDVAGAITANGGGGGAPTGGDNGARGATTSSSAAAGGTFSCVETPGAVPVTRRGGAGGSRGATATDGTTCTAQDAAMVVISSQGGGGGGAAGRTHIRRHTGTTTGVQSPTAQVEDVSFE